MILQPKCFNAIYDFLVHNNWNSFFSFNHSSNELNLAYTEISISLIKFYLFTYNFLIMNERQLMCDKAKTDLKGCPEK